MVRRGKSVKFKILGSASGIPTTERFSASTAIFSGGRTYLFDAGEPCAVLLLRAKVNIYTLRAVFISHMHADHVSGLPLLIQTMQLLAKRSRQNRFRPDNKLQLYVPGEAVHKIRESLNMLYLMPETLPFELDVRPVGEGPIYRDPEIVISAFPNRHLMVYEPAIARKYPFNNMESYSFVAKVGKKRIVYSGDIASVEELTPCLREKVDVLLLEAAHIDLERALHFLSSKRIDTVVLTHVKLELDKEREKLMRLGKKYVRGRFNIACDGFELVI